MTAIQDGRAPAAAANPELWPLTAPQNALWFLDNFNPGSSFYVIGMGLRLRGQLDVTALNAALTDCVHRHPALRARFVALAGRPYQFFAPVETITLDVDDAADEHAVQEELDTLSNRPFDLSAEAPLRLRLLRLSPEHHVLVLVVHHIVFDGWSTQVLLSDLAAAYRAHRAGDAARLAPLETTPSEYALRFANHAVPAADAGNEHELGYWRRVLDAAPSLELPTDFARPATRSFVGAAVAANLDEATTAAVHELAHRLGVTAFTVTATAFNLVLAQMSGQRDLVVGVPLAGRVEQQTHDLIGMFANALPLRVDVEGVESFTEAVERHRGPVLELLARQHVPFAAIVDRLSPKRVANRNPYFDICFQYLPAPERTTGLDGLDLEVLGGHRRASQFDLSCDVHDLGDGLRIQIEYSTELFTEDTVRTYLETFIGVLTQAVADPGQLPAVRGYGTDAPERAVATGTWLPGGLAGIVARQARDLPEAVAVRHGRTSLTYQELDAAAGGFAERLLERGIGVGDRVGLLLSPSASLPIAMLGILRLGAAYVPVDPRTPKARAAAMMAAAGCPLLVHDTATAPLAKDLGVPLLPFGDVAVGESGADVPTAAVEASTPAYVIFTSGSTGRPKAVVVGHGAAVSLAASAARVYELDAADTVLQMASAAVDVSVEEYFASWYAGAAVAVHGPEIDDLDELVARYRLNVLNLPAGLWHEWARQLTERGADVPEHVRLVVAGSERLDPARVRDWRRGPGRATRLLNAYGLTETAVSSVWYDTASFDTDSAFTPNVPIGRALPHVRLYVLDDAGRVVGDGVPGELFIGGAGMALGYLGDPDATAERFVPDPFDGRDGAVMYRTGDRVRRLPSGVLDFLGRTDTQVKIRGTRVDLTEVERVGGEVPGIAGFAVDLRADETGTARLVGYVLPGDGGRDTDGAGGQRQELDRVEQWRAVHDEEIFNDTGAVSAADLNTSGWLSSYTMEPIADEAMAEWRDGVVGRLLPTLEGAGPSGAFDGTRGPGRVLEIGCGTGMLLFPIAPYAEAYVGTDIAPRALEYVRSQLPPTAGLAEGRVRLLETAAHDLSDLGDDTFDLIVVNSVVQYFPSATYLRDVLREVWRRLRPGGRVFVGDVRDLTTLRAFHLSLQRFRHPDVDNPGAVAEAVDDMVSAEGELCLHPVFFRSLAAEFPGAAVEIQAKAGRFDTEMNRYRYDVVLHKDAEPFHASRRLDGRCMDLEGLAAVLRDRGGLPVLVAGVPDARTFGDVLLEEEIGSGRWHSLADAKRAVRAAVPGIHPADIYDLAAEHSTPVAVVPAGGGRVDVVLGASRLPMTAPSTGAPPAAAATAPDLVVANQPLAATSRRDLIERIREHLSAHLPAAMVPGRLVFVERFPLSLSGKIDRARLPDPPRRGARAGRTAPRGPVEQLLADTWARVLNLDVVGVDDNFFEVGGDSITWLQIMSRCAKSGLKLVARDAFDHQTIAALAQAVIARQKATTAAVELVAEANGPVGLTPIQHWFLDAYPTGRDRQNQCQWFELAEGCPLPVLRTAVLDVLHHHPTLAALRPHLDRPVPTQQRVPLPAADALPVTEVWLPVEAGMERVAFLRSVSDRDQDSVAVDGPLFQLTVVRTPDGEADLVFWCVHHWAVDAVSWQFLGEDLDEAIAARRAGTAPVLPPPSAGYAAWAVACRRAADTMAAQELTYWRDVAGQPALALPVTVPDASSTLAAAHTATAEVPIGAGPGAGGEVLAGCLSALCTALEEQAGLSAGTVWLEYHGRELTGPAPDVSRTVGWFTAMFPFLLDGGDQVATVRRRLGEVPGGGVGFGLARYLRGEPLTTGANVVVNYLGPGAPADDAQQLRPTSLAAEAIGPDVDTAATMPFALEVGFSMRRDGRLSVHCTAGARYMNAGQLRNFVVGLASQLADVFAAHSTGSGVSAGSGVSTDSGVSADQAETDGRYPLTAMQQVMLNRHLLNPAKDANYNENVLNLAGDLDEDLLQRAWQALATRHEALRTSIEWDSGDPVQQVHPGPVAPIRVLDWSGLSEQRILLRWEHLLAEERANPPKLSGRPPFRLTLVRTGPAESRLLWIDHHILLDGWSSTILTSELTRAYHDLETGGEPLNGLSDPVSFGSYLRWLDGRDRGMASAYWRRTLTGFSAATALPFDTAPGALSPAAGDYEESEIELGGAALEAVRDLARRTRTTAGSVFAAAWAALLHRFTGDPDVLFGVALSGRPAELGDVAGMVGLYMTTLPLRAAAGSRTVEQLLESVSEQSWQLAEVAGVGSPWDIHDWAGIPVSRTLFHSVLVVHNYGAPAAQKPDTEASGLQIGSSQGAIRTGVPLTIAVDPQRSVVRLVWDTRFFTAGTAEQVLETLRSILDRMSAAPNSPVAELPIPRFTVRPVAAMADPSAGRVPDPPRGAAEEAVAQIWQQVLGLERVDREINLFEVGANSISATRLHARLCEHFDLELPLAELFRRPTVAAQAQLVGVPDMPTVDVDAQSGVSREDRMRRRRQALNAGTAVRRGRGGRA